MKFAPKERLVWISVDENTGQKVQELVEVMAARVFQGREHYQVRVLRSGDPVNAWGDELFRWEKAGG